jgi:hypothetical protein
VDYAGAGNCYNPHHLITHPKAPTMADYTPPKIDWVYNLRANPEVEIRDATEVFNMKVREVIESVERQ